MTGAAGLNGQPIPDVSEATDEGQGHATWPAPKIASVTFLISIHALVKSDFLFGAEGSRRREKGENWKWVEI